MDHLADGGVEAGKEGAAHDGMPDVQLAEMRYGEYVYDVCVVYAVPGVDEQTMTAGETRGADEALEFPLLVSAGGVGECAGVQLDEIGPKTARGFDLLGIGLDEEADADAGGLEAADGGLELPEVAVSVETAFGGDFAPVLGNEADVLGEDAQGDGENLRSIAHLEVEPSDDALAEAKNVAILDVPAIGAQVDGDAARPRAFAHAGGGNDIGLDILSLWHRGVASLPEGGDVVDIDAELQERHRAGRRRDQ